MMSNKLIFKLSMLVLLLLIVTSCKKVCPKGYKYSKNMCYTYDILDAELEYDCNRGGKLNNKICIIEENNCIDDINESCIDKRTYIASKTFKCPENYELSGKKCYKIKYYEK